MPQKKAAVRSLILDLTGQDRVKSPIESRLQTPAEPGKEKLLDRVRAVLRLKHYSLRTEHSYVDWIKRFLRFHAGRETNLAAGPPKDESGRLADRMPVLLWRHPETMGAGEVREFLSHLAVKGGVAASTQNQAFSALLFLYRDVLQQELPWIEDGERAKRPAKLPVVFTKQEARSVLNKLHGTARLMANLLYGCGLRLSECVRLRIKDVDFGYLQITIRDAKGGRDRVRMLRRS